MIFKKILAFLSCLVLIGSVSACNFPLNSIPKPDPATVDPTSMEEGETNADGYTKKGQFYEKNGEIYVYDTDGYTLRKNSSRYEHHYQEENMYEIGDTISIDGFDFRVNSVSRTKELTDFIKEGCESAGRADCWTLREGYSYVTIDTTTTNLTDQRFDNCYVASYHLQYTDEDGYELIAGGGMGESIFFYDVDQSSFKQHEKSYWFDSFEPKQSRNLQFVTKQPDESLDSAYTYIEVYHARPDLPIRRENSPEFNKLVRVKW